MSQPTHQQHPLHPQQHPFAGPPGPEAYAPPQSASPGRPQGAPGGMPPGGPHAPRPGGPQQGQAFGPPPAAPRGTGTATVWGLGLASVAAVVAGLSIPEDGATGWDTVHAWGALAVLGAVLTLAPVALSTLTATRAWQASACGAGALVLFWVLFVLPVAGSNTSLVATVGVAAGVVATWLAPGREPLGEPGREAGRRPNDGPRPSVHSW